MRDAEPLVRASAATALAKFGPAASGVIPQLSELLNDSSTVVKLAATDAINKLNSSAAQQK